LNTFLLLPTGEWIMRAIATKFPAPEGGRRDDHENANDGSKRETELRRAALYLFCLLSCLPSLAFS
jgi:hypothetical protein